MLLEFTLARSETEKKLPQRNAYVLMNQLVGVHEPPAFSNDNGEPLRRCEISLRSGQRFEVLESVEDVLDAMKFATRHIGVTPGIADKVDGESEEVYPWRRTEKVAELARKWRARQQAEANKGKAPPPMNLPVGSRVGSAIVDPHFIPPSPPPSPTESSGEAPSAGCATPEPTSESSEASGPAPK